MLSVTVLHFQLSALFPSKCGKNRQTIHISYLNVMTMLFKKEMIFFFMMQFIANRKTRHEKQNIVNK